MKTKILLGMSLALSSTFSANAIAGPVSIGLDLTGTSTWSGPNFVTSTLWTDITDTGVSVGPIVLNAIHDFSGQVRVGTLTNNGLPVTPLGLNAAANLGPFFAANGLVGPFEITKQYSFQEQIKNIIPDPTNPLINTVIFGNPPSPNPGPNLSIYLDYYNDTTDVTQAIPGSGPTAVKNYGNDSTYVPAPAGSNNPLSPDTISAATTGDGALILQAKLINNVSSFTGFGSGTGTGSYDLTYEFTYVNPLFVTGLAAGNNFSERFTGTLTQPTGTIPNPDVMWNGTTSTGTDHYLFKVDSSESFAVPEPESLGLLGLGLLGLAPSVLRRRKLKANC